jgi:hypothetical protein
MQVEVDDVEELAVGRDIHRRRKHAQSYLAQHSIRFRGVFPDRAEGRAVCERDEVELLVSGDRHPVRPIQVRRHDARAELMVNACALRPETHERNLVRRFRNHVD